MGGMLIGGSFCIVDSIFLGNGVGPLALAAVTLSLPLVMLSSAFGDMLGNGAAVLISQANGARDTSKTQIIFGNMLSLIMLFSLLFALICFPFCKEILLLFGATKEILPQALEYSQIMILGAFPCIVMTCWIAIIRNDNRPILSMLIMVLGLGGNIFLDWLLIMYLKWGIAGAAYATIISQSVATFAGIIYFLTPKTKLKFSLSTLIFKLKISKDIIITGIPIFGNMLTVNAMLFMHNFQALRYGGNNGLASYAVIANLEALGSMLMTGLACGVQPIVANSYGATKHKRKNLFGNYGYWSAFILGICLMMFSILCRNAMPEWTGLTGEVAKMASHGIVLSSTAFILLGVIRVAAYYYQATDKITYSSLMTYGDAFFALPLCLFILPLFIGLNGVWLAMAASRVILFIILLYLWYGQKQKN